MRLLAPQISVIIAAYNQASTLKLLLESLESQTLGASVFEVIVADDGSSDSSVELSGRKWGFDLVWVTQEDRGYRKAKILNQAVRSSKSDYLIFLDADVVLERHFLEDHLSLRRLGYFVCGRRVDLGPVLSQKISQRMSQRRHRGLKRGGIEAVGIEAGDGVPLCSILMSGLRKDSRYVKRGIRIPYPWIRRCLGYDKPIDLLGSNFSLWKSDLIAVNGFNEALESYWGEDGDLFIRLQNSGGKSIGAKGLCIQFHIFHTRRTPTPENVAQYEKRLHDPQYRWAAKGYQN